MPYREIVGQIKYPTGVSERYKTLDQFQRVLDGTIYEHLPYPFTTEVVSGVQVAFEKRRPSVKLNLAKVLHDQTSSLLWGDEQIPHVRVLTKDTREADDSASQALDELVTDLCLDDVMAEAYEAAFVGSAAIIVRGLDDGVPDFDVMDGKYCTPFFSPTNPNRLVKLVIEYPVKGDVLATMREDVRGKTIDSTRHYWLRIEIDEREERRFVPLRDDEFDRLQEEDPKRADGSAIKWELEPDYPVPHKFGQANVVWIRTPGARKNIDGPCVFGAVVDNLVEIDYLKSYVGRGFKYIADPTLAIEQNGNSVGGMVHALNGLSAGGKDPDEMEPDEVEAAHGRGQARTASAVLRLAPGESAKILELTGAGVKAAGEHADRLREDTLEVLGGQKASAENTKGPQSGRALELLMQALFLVVRKMRRAFGRNALLPLLRLVLIGVQNEEIVVDRITPEQAGKMLGMLLDLLWPRMLKLAGTELLQMAQAWGILIGSTQKFPKPILPDEIVVEMAANDLGQADVGKIVRDQLANLKTLIAMYDKENDGGADPAADGEDPSDDPPGGKPNPGGNPKPSNGTKTGRKKRNDTGA